MFTESWQLVVCGIAVSLAGLGAGELVRYLKVKWSNIANKMNLTDKQERDLAIEEKVNLQKQVQDLQEKVRQMSDANERLLRSEAHAKYDRSQEFGRAELFKAELENSEEELGKLRERTVTLNRQLGEATAKCEAEGRRADSNMALANSYLNERNDAVQQTNLQCRRAERAEQERDKIEASLREVSAIRDAKVKLVDELTVQLNASSDALKAEQDKFSGLREAIHTALSIVADVADGRPKRIPIDTSCLDSTSVNEVRAEVATPAGYKPKGELIAASRNGRYVDIIAGRDGEKVHIIHCWDDGEAMRTTDALNRILSGRELLRAANPPAGLASPRAWANAENNIVRLKLGKLNGWLISGPMTLTSDKEAARVAKEINSMLRWVTNNAHGTEEK